MSQLEMLREAFDRGEELTVAEALTRYGVYALSQRVGELAKTYPIDREIVTLPNGKHVARYSKFRCPYG